MNPIDTMKKHLQPAALIGAALVLTCLTPLAFAAEKKIQRSELPPAVEKTVQEQSKGATIKGLVMETENGKVEYEVEMTVNGHGKDVAIAKDGKVIEIEEEVALEAIPPAAQKALQARAAGAKIIKVEALTKGSKLVGYEAATLKGTKKGEVAVGPNGEKVAQED